MTDNNQPTSSRRGPRTDRVRTGMRMQRLRIERGVSMAQMAREVGVSRQMMWNYERGLSAMAAHRARRIAEILGVTVDELLS